MLGNLIAATAFHLCLVVGLPNLVQGLDVGPMNPCVSARYCTECVATEGAHCGWCSNPELLENRCDLVQNLAAWCPSTMIFSTENPPPDREISSSQCNYHGALECGQCSCDKGYYGKTCDLTGLASRSDEDLEACIDPYRSDKLVCSGRGECVYGMCECYPRRANSAQKYSGKFCQCDDYNCPYHNNQICGGHGECRCGECICQHGYKGDYCGCPTSNATCVSDNLQVCNGHGVCECGVCRCNPESGFKGPTCEECPTCPGKCTQNRNCALCVGFHTGPYTKDACSVRCGHVSVVPVVDEEAIANGEANLCQFLDSEDDCRYFFTYSYVGSYNQVAVEVQSTKECPPPINRGKQGESSPDTGGKHGEKGAATAPEPRVSTVVLLLLALLY